MKNIIIIGGGGHAKVLASVLKKHPSWNPVGYVDLSDKGNLLDLPYLGRDENLSEILKEKQTDHAAIGIGQIKNVASRKVIVNKLKKLKIQFPAIISTDAIVNEDVKIGQGTVIMDGVIIQPGSKIGQFSIINTGATIDHDCEIDDFIHIAPGVTLSGGVKISDNTLIGTGAKVIQGIEIGNDIIIASGSTVTKNLKKTGIYFGSPVKLLRRQKR